MLLLIPACQQTTVHLGVKGFHSALANLGEARNITDIGNLQAAITQCCQGTTCGDNLPTQLRECSGKLHNASLIANAD